MSDSEGEFRKDNTVEEDEERLKYFAFVYLAATNTTVYLSNIYVYAKNKSGTLKPGVQSVEEKMKTVAIPLYQRFHGLPIRILKYVDQKVDVSVLELDGRVPVVVKEISAKAISAVQKAPSIARSVANEVHRSGVVDTALELAKGVYSKYEPTAKGLYTKYEAVAGNNMVLAWFWLNSLPIVPHVTTAVTPVAASLSEKYNHVVNTSAERGNAWAAYFPLVPTEKITKAFGGGATTVHVQ